MSPCETVEKAAGSMDDATNAGETTRARVGALADARAPEDERRAGGRGRQTRRIASRPAQVFGELFHRGRQRLLLRLELDDAAQILRLAGGSAHQPLPRVGGVDRVVGFLDGPRAGDEIAVEVERRIPCLALRARALPQSTRPAAPDEACRHGAEGLVGEAAEFSVHARRLCAVSRVFLQPRHALQQVWVLGRAPVDGQRLPIHGKALRGSSARGGDIGFDDGRRRIDGARGTGREVQELRGRVGGDGRPIGRDDDRGARGGQRLAEPRRKRVEIERPGRQVVRPLLPPVQFPAQLAGGLVGGVVQPAGELRLGGAPFLTDGAEPGHGKGERGQ